MKKESGKSVPIFYQNFTRPDETHRQHAKLQACAIRAGRDGTRLDAVGVRPASRF